jgi:outer membrane protein TolC
MEGALAGLQAARHGRAFDVASAYYDLVRARGEAAAVAESARLAHELVALVRRRVEVGEAPQVQVTRAQIEAARVDQELVRAGGAVVSRLATLRLLIGDESLLHDAVGKELPDEPAPPELPSLLTQALLNRAEVARARTLVEVAEAEVGIARANRRPSLYGGVSADIWSLDRNPFQSQNLGLQAFLSFPLLDRGSLRADEARTRALVSAAQREVEAVKQQVRIEVTRAAQELGPRLRVAANYRTQILPQSQELLDATRRGYEAGLSTLLDVVDAQRTARLTRTEHLNALHDALRADLELRRAAGTLAPIPAGSKESTK